MSSLISFTCSRTASNGPKKKRGGKKKARAKPPTAGIKTALVYRTVCVSQGLPCQAFGPLLVAAGDVNTRRRAQAHTSVDVRIKSTHVSGKRRRRTKPRREGWVLEIDIKAKAGKLEEMKAGEEKR